MIFSTGYSEGLWRDISLVKKRKTQIAIFNLACKCQDLESYVIKLEEKIDKLLAKEKPFGPAGRS